MGFLADALALAEAGIPIFPVNAGRKTPAVAGGFHAATTDHDQIRAWWGQNPQYNVACCPEHAGWAVVDIDSGMDAWGRLCHEHGHVPTYTVETPRGGRHYYYAGSLPSSAGRLAPGIDTRGKGGYVLLPPSVVNGRPYTVLHDCAIAPLPAWIAERIGRYGTVLTGPTVTADPAMALDRARTLLAAMLARGDIAIAGAAGNSRTYRLCCELRNLGVPQDQVSELLAAWNAACHPPWEVAELEGIIRHAWQYGVEGEGSRGLEAMPTEVFSAAVQATMPARPSRPRFHLRDEAEMDDSREPAWLVDDLIPRGATAMLLGAPRTYKSFLALDLALSLASGRSTFRSPPRPPEIAIYTAAEGLHSIQTKRRRAWRTWRSIDGPIPHFFTTRAPLLGLSEGQEYIDHIGAGIEDQPVSLIVLDTVGKIMGGLDENSATDANTFCRFADTLAETFDCAVLALHHSGKDRERGARGSSAFFGGFDTVLEARRVGDSPNVEVWVRKQKDAAERETPWRFRAQPFGASIVMEEIDAARHAEMVEAANPISRVNIKKLLMARGAGSLATATFTAILAEDAGLEADGVKRLVQEGRRGKLRIYCEDVGGELHWWAPHDAT